MNIGYMRSLTSVDCNFSSSGVYYRPDPPLDSSSVRSGNTSRRGN